MRTNIEIDDDLMEKAKKVNERKKIGAVDLYRDLRRKGITIRRKTTA